jgi:hypothetical protein
LNNARHALLEPVRQPFSNAHALNAGAGRHHIVFRLIGP